MTEHDVLPVDANKLPAHLPLLEAFVRWVDPTLIESIRQCERCHTTYELAATGGPCLTQPSERRIPQSTDWMSGGANFTMLNAAWTAAIHDFRSKIEQGILHLEGVEVGDDLNAQPQAIPGAFASECQFDLLANRLKLGKRRFAALDVSDAPQTWAMVEVVGRPGITKASELPPVETLTDEQILDLLNEHARRVTESPGPKMMARIKDVLQPLVVRRIEYRAREGLLAPTVGEEAEEIRRWIGEVAKWHPKPAQKTAENNIRTVYNREKARSRA